MKTIDVNKNSNIGFQIAPMIDVVFVILVFFMALAGQIKIEQILKTRLPGVAAADAPVEFFDEQIITINEDGEVLLNDDPMALPDDRRMRDLANTMLRLKQSSEAARSQLVVTIISAETARYARTIDVLNVLAEVGVTNVSFTVTPEF
jgi:biopolymer transport protein ExbD